MKHEKNYETWVYKYYETWRDKCSNAQKDKNYDTWCDNYSYAQI